MAGACRPPNCAFRSSAGWPSRCARSLAKRWMPRACLTASQCSRPSRSVVTVAASSGGADVRHRSLAAAQRSANVQPLIRCPPCALAAALTPTLFASGLVLATAAGNRVYRNNLDGTFRCEVRDSYIHTAADPNPAAAADPWKKQKMDDLNANDVEHGMRIIAGTARSMGVEVDA